MLVTVVIVVVLVALIWRLTGRPKGLPPGPTCYPIIGNVGLYKPSDAVKANRNLRKQYGDIYTVMFFHKPKITVHGYNNIQDLLVKNEDLFLERPSNIINGILNKGKGLLMSSGPVWKDHSTFALTTMRKLGIGKHSLQCRIMEEVACLINEVDKFENNPFDIHYALNNFALNVLCSLLFGKRFDHEDAKFKNLIKLLHNMVACTKLSSPAFIFPLLRFLPMSGFHDMEKSFQDIDAFTNEIIKEHRQHFDGNNINDYVDIFLFEQSQRKKSTFTDEQLIISVRDIFGAGAETIATTLRWAVLFLIHHPDWQKKLREDVNALLGQSHPKMEHKEQLPRVEAFILEVQRHANIVPFAIPRAPKKDFRFNGHNFPKGTSVCFALDSVLMDPDIFPEPSKFKPERFLDKSGKCNGEPKEKLIPFSTGQRSCLGKYLAKMELFLFVTRFLQKFELKPENPHCLPSLEHVLGLTNQPKPFNIILVKR